MDRTLNSATHALYKDFTADATLRNVMIALTTDMHREMPIRPEELGALVEEADADSRVMRNIRSSLTLSADRLSCRSEAGRSYRAAAQYLAATERGYERNEQTSFRIVEPAGTVPRFF